MERTASAPTLKAVIATMLVGMAVPLTACQQKQGIEVKSEAPIEQELALRLPRGTASADVETWLAGKGITHSGLIDNAKLAHMGADPQTYEIKALIRGSAKPALVRTDTQVTFVFDRERRLVSSTVAPVHTGL